jgi:aminopeptidase-like protein
MLGLQMYQLMQRLYPICRSITGDGVRQTLRIIQEYIPIKISEVSTGTKVFDWTVPREWNIRDAYIKNSRGEKIVDFKESNIHVLNYSIPVNKRMGREELKQHLFSLPEHPEWIPYLTSYYKDNWGFCLSHKQYESLQEDIYEVVIDSSLENGSLTFAELEIPGQSEKEILFTCYVCHPSLCNDNLSGVVLLTFLAQHMLGTSLKYSYRFLFIPETIGAIAWLAINEQKVRNIQYALLATCVGDDGFSTYKKTRSENSFIDKVVEKVLVDSGEPYKILPYSPYGSDERQFSSPGFAIPMGSLMRTSYGCFPEYHTSADNLNFIKPVSLENSLKKYMSTIFVVENDRVLISTNQKCEPQLGKRGLYKDIGSRKKSEYLEEAIFWILNLCDGSCSLLDIAIRSKLPFEDVKEAAMLLCKHGLLNEITEQGYAHEMFGNHSCTWR